MMIGVDPALKEVSANESVLPEWLKNVALYWGQGLITDQEYINGIQWMIDNGILELNSDSEMITTNDNLDTDLGIIETNDNLDTDLGIIETNDNWSPEHQKYYDAMPPESKKDVDMYYNEFYNGLSSKDKNRFNDLFVPIQLVIPVNESFGALFSLYDDNSIFESVISNVSSDLFMHNVETCDDSLHPPHVQVDYSVYNHTPVSYQLEYDVLGVDIDGNEVSYGFSLIDVEPKTTSVTTLLIPGHPLLVDCVIQLQTDKIVSMKTSLN